MPHINRRHYALKAEKNVVVNFISRCTSGHKCIHMNLHMHTNTQLPHSPRRTQTLAQQTEQNHPIVRVMNKLFHECFLPCTSPPLSLTLPRSVHNTSCLYQHITVNGVITALHYLVMAPLFHLLVSTPWPGL